MNSLFIENEHQSSLENKGYLILDLLEENDIQNLCKLYAETIASQKKTGLFESSRNNTADINNLIKQNIQTIINPYIQTIFQDYSFYGGTFMIKSSNLSNEFPLHQDWNIVDEKKHTALFFWIPLLETNEQNGSIFLIEGSHKLFHNYRSGSYKSLLIERNKIDKKYIKSINLQLGQVLIYLPQLFHGSYKNNSDKDRIVITSMITNKDAPLYNFNKKNETEATIYQIQPSSYLNDISLINDGKIPNSAELIDTIPYIHPIINHKVLNKVLTGKDYGIWQQIKTFIQNKI